MYFMLSRPQTRRSLPFIAPLPLALRSWRAAHKCHLPRHHFVLKSGYTIPLARFTAAFRHAGDNHPRVLTYLHYRLKSIDTSSMDGMGSRLIRQDAVHDNDRGMRGNPRNTRRRTMDGGFLTNATEDEIGRLFTMARPDNTAQRLDVLMTHYAHLADDVQLRVDALIRQEVDSLTAATAATAGDAPAAPSPRRNRTLTPTSKKRRSSSTRMRTRRSRWSTACRQRLRRTNRVSRLTTRICSAVAMAFEHFIRKIPTVLHVSLWYWYS
jgi:hypothetical protein